MTDHDPQHTQQHDHALDADDAIEALDASITDEQPTNETASAALAQSFASGRQQAQAIAEMCLIASQPQRTAEFLAAGLTEAQVRRSLLDARADQPEIASRITADASTSTRPEHSPVVAAAKKLAHKE